MMIVSYETMVSEENIEAARTRTVRERRWSVTDAMLESYGDADLLAMFTSGFEIITEAKVLRPSRVDGLGLFPDDPDVAAVVIVRGVPRDPDDE